MTETHDTEQLAPDTKQTAAEIPVTLNAPAAADIPEEGFVPVALEYQQKKQKRKQILLAVLAILMLLIGIFLFSERRFNFYNKVMRSLNFNYQTGESVTDSSLL